MKETIREEWVKCGRAGCRMCPHGPYYYAYWRQDGKLKKRYIGKVKEPQTTFTVTRAPPSLTEPTTWLAKLTLEEACQLLRCKPHHKRSYIKGNLTYELGKVVGTSQAPQEKRAQLVGAFMVIERAASWE